MPNLRKLTLFISISLSLSTFAAEFVIINQSVTLTSANNGFSFFYNPTNGPVDWTSPDNYYNGQVYFRFEVLSQPTNEINYLSFDIWGDYDGSTYTESAAPISGALAGTGSVSTFNSSPSTWYPHPVTGSVDFTDRTSFWRWGVCHWFSKNPNFLLAPKNWSDDPESWEAWTHKETWLPITIKVTIVAVSQGSSFSGWDNYITPPSKHPVPTYGIDYSASLTNKVVPSTDEYSVHADMSGAVSGNGQKIEITPGQDVYFRTKASGGLLASDIQHLVVQYRPSTPSVTIDFVNEVTSSVANTIEYSTSSSMSPATTGTNTAIPVIPGNDLYFRVKSTATQFKSDIQTLDVPDRVQAPEITIDYVHETTSPVSDLLEYSTSISMSPATTGTNTAIPVIPGNDLYFRVKSTATQFKSDIQTLDVPDRVQTPEIAIDYIHETTSPVSDLLEYSTSSSMSPSTTGSNTSIPLSPGTDMYIRIKATISQFSSVVEALEVPDRPATPDFAVDFQNEKTSTAVSTSFEYAENKNLNDAISGNDLTVPLIPGSVLYFRQKATSSQFASLSQELDVPSRPTATAYNIDFVQETTLENVHVHDEYADTENMNGAQTGADTTLSLLPGNNYHLRIKSTSTSFAGEIFHLDTPVRPVISSDVTDTVTSEFFTASIVFSGDTTGFELSDLESTNAEITLTEPAILKIFPVETGAVSVRVKANAVLAGNFASELLSTYYKKVVTSVPDLKDSKGFITLYPNPSGSFIHIVSGNNPARPLEIIIMDCQGNIVVHNKMADDRITLDIGFILPGIYLLHAIDSFGNHHIQKFIKQ